MADTQYYDRFFNPYQGDYSTYGQNVPGATPAHSFYDYKPRSVDADAPEGALTPLLLPEDIQTNQSSDRDGGEGRTIRKGGGDSNLGRMIAEMLGQPQQTSAYGVTEIHPLASLISAFFPGGTMAMGGMRASNLSNIKDVQGSLGVAPDDQASMWNILNPLSKLARGSSEASLGKTKIGGRDYDVTFGGLTEEGKTSLTPNEARLRQQSAKREEKKKQSQRDNDRESRGGGGYSTTTKGGGAPTGYSGGPGKRF